MATTGQPRKPVSRKKNREAGGTKRQRGGSKRPPMALPRPDKFTFIIIAVGALVAAGLMFFAVRNTTAAAESAADDRAEAEATLNSNRQKLAEHEANQVYSGPALAAVVGPAEAFLPNVESAPQVTEQVNAVVDSAEVAGLVPGEFATSGRFVDAGGAKRYDFPLTVSGNPAAITAWFEALYAQQPLITFTTTGGTYSEGEATVNMDVTLWATSDEEWGSGRSSGAALEGLEGLSGGAGG
jgi:hypothetical protein